MTKPAVALDKAINLFFIPYSAFGNLQNASNVQYPVMPNNLIALEVLDNICLGFLYFNFTSN